MKRIVKYIAKDGTEFDSSEECNEHDRRVRFVNAIAKFVTDKLAEISDEDLAQMSRVWEIVFNDPAAMIAVAEAAQEPKRRGRPKKKKITIPVGISTEISKNSVDIKPELTKTTVNSENVKPNKVEELKVVAKLPVVPKSWRSIPPSLQTQLNK